MKKLLLAPLAADRAPAGPAGARAPGVAAQSAWTDGKSDSDRL